MTRHTIKSLRTRSGHGPQGRALRRIWQMVRRMRITATDGARWVLAGFVDGDGNEEPEEAEAFEGIAFAARPAVGDNAEVIIIKVGGESGHPAVVASRHRDWLRNLVDAEGLAAGECAMFNGTSMVKIRTDGVIEGGTIGGSRGPLATKADLDTLLGILWAWTPVSTDGGLALRTLLAAQYGGSATPGGVPPQWECAGTQKLEAE